MVEAEQIFSCLAPVYSLELNAYSSSWIAALVSSLGQNPCLFSSSDSDEGEATSIWTSSYLSRKSISVGISRQDQDDCWCLVSVGDAATYCEHMDTILEGLPRDFDFVIVLIESCLPHISIEEAEGLILAQELCLQKTCQTQLIEQFLRCISES